MNGGRFLVGGMPPSYLRSRAAGSESLRIRRPTARSTHPSRSSRRARPTTRLGASVSLAFGGDVAAHSSIIACVTVYNTAVTLAGVTDTRLNAYTTVMGPLDGNGTRHYRRAVGDGDGRVQGALKPTARRP